MAREGWLVGYSVGARERDAATRQLGYVAECDCWRCAEQRGEDVYGPEFRGRRVDPLTCAHAEDLREPVSGDAWLCGDCGVFAPAPSDEHVTPAGEP